MTAPVPFIKRIAVAWLMAADFSYENAKKTQRDKNVCEHWEEKAERYETQSSLVLALHTADQGTKEDAAQVT